MSRPDAVMIPRDRESTANDDATKESVVEVAESLLECEPLELAWCHDQVNYFFCTRTAEDTEFYPGWHPATGKPRYRWDVKPDGVKLGYLLE